MEHFSRLDHEVAEHIFEIPPLPFTRSDPKEVLAVALGATLYTPGIRDGLADVVLRRRDDGATSTVLCLEDSIADSQVQQATYNVIGALRVLSRTLSQDDPPLVFVRVRSPQQIGAITAELGEAVDVLSGFVMPKFNHHNAQAYLDALMQARRDGASHLYAMPVLEDPQIIHARTRQKALTRIEKALHHHRDQVLALRIGATDFMSAYGLRRNPDHTIYDVKVVADVMADIVNRLGRTEDGHVITGPVWEFFTGGERLFRPTLRLSLFEDHHAESLRAQLMSREMDGLIREVHLDRANGLQGKTVIHPSHVPVVNALQVVTHEEYSDALAVLSSEGGASSSEYRNKMNEARPHTAWAQRTMLRAKVFGVTRPDMTFVEVLAASATA